MIASYQLASHYLPSCARCYKPDSRAGGIQLKRCARCTAVRYCSKECQREDWPVHKKVCQSATVEHGDLTDCLRSYGISSVAELSRAVVTWAETHNEAFTDLLSATVVLNEGMRPNLVTSRVLLVQLNLGFCNERDGNPATTFSLHQVSIRSLDDPEFAQSHKDWPAIREIAMKRYLAIPSLIFAGVIPATFVVLNTGIVLEHHWPVYKILGRDCNNPDAETRAICKDLYTLVRATMSHGIVLKTPENTFDIVPGILVRKKKKWEWMAGNPDFSWDPYLVDSLAETMESGLHPREVLRKFRPFPLEGTANKCSFLTISISSVASRLTLVSRFFVNRAEAARTHGCFPRVTALSSPSDLSMASTL
ncbi:hypothetical protein C2E23DRAFT_740102 [Lenzites betulinus]|nr:hypothetical protein C2E23DRAFT_740102 [Lenzites betulinus]